MRKRAPNGATYDIVQADIRPDSGIDEICERCGAFCVRRDDGSLQSMVTISMVAAWLECTAEHLLTNGQPNEAVRMEAVAVMLRDAERRMEGPASGALQ